MRNRLLSLCFLGMLAATDLVAGSLVRSPASLDFGNVAVNGPPASATLTITNIGGATTISGFTKSGGCAEFSVSAPGLPVILGNNASLVVTVTYDPADRAADACTITIQDDNGVTDAFPVTGDGLAAALMLDTPALAFADQPWASGPGQTLQLAFTNAGELPIDVANLGLALQSGAHFSAGAPVGLPAGPGEQAFVPVTFDPASPGPKLDVLTLSLDNDAPGAPNPTVSLSGTGLEENTGVGDGPAGAALAAGPSPSRGTLRVALAVPRPGRLTLEVRDVAGRLAARALRFDAAAGARTLVLRDGAEWSPAPGVYFVRAALDGTPLGSARVLVLR